MKGGGAFIISVKCFYLTAVTVLDYLMRSELSAVLRDYLPNSFFQARLDQSHITEGCGPRLHYAQTAKVNVKSVLVARLYSTTSDRQAKDKPRNACWLYGLRSRFGDVENTPAVCFSMIFTPVRKDVRAQDST